ncbi:hypothetical protein BFP70_05670 [Thioclava sp. SK-1]|uniref:DoxX family protein n=1 Tax=Thioclava sp. SK-1 TaxID=1889770 RepID=UPI0008254830|nr:DoxX family protein [Thioclava sp. SK-1]OCX66354.1 hypothetical protein BFP70_05670 [Thioclava sp. SK-1]
MIDLSPPGILALLLAAFFLIGAAGNAIGPGPVRADYARWGFPSWFRHVTAALELATALLLVLIEQRLFGIALGGAVMAGALLTLIQHQEFRHAIAPAVVIALLLALWVMT